MKIPPFIVIVIIALGAVTGSTIATVNYLNNRRNAAISQDSLSQPSPASYSPSLTPTPIPNTLSKQEVSPQSNPNNFSQFRLRFLEAVKRRDTNFIRALVTPQTKWSFEGATTLESYNINDLQSPFWYFVTKAVGAGCVIDPRPKLAEQEVGSEVWVCPETVGQPIYNFGWQNQIAILGQGVNVRSEPNTNGAIVGGVSQEIVTFDADTFSNLPQQIQESVTKPDGWTPIVLFNGKRGWVQNRFIFYEPRDYRVSFIRSNGQWRLHYLLQGDGN